MKITRLAALAVIPLMLALGACSQATTDSTQQAIRYAGGSLDAETFKNCQSGPAIDYGDPGDKIYYYPAAQRTFAFDDAAGAKVETGPLSVSTKSPGQEVTIRGYVTFQMTSDCEKLRKFHELIGKRMGADFVQGAQEDDGWSAFLAQYFGLPINEIFDSVGSAYTWQELYAGRTATDPNLQQTVQTKVKEELAARINGNIGDGVIVVNGVDIQRPSPDPGLLEALRGTEQARQEAAQRVAKAEGDTQVAAQENKLKEEQAKADGVCLKYYTNEQCTIQKLAAQDQLKNLQQGSTLRVKNVE